MALGGSPFATMARSSCEPARRGQWRQRRLVLRVAERGLSYARWSRRLGGRGGAVLEDRRGPQGMWRRRCGVTSGSPAAARSRAKEWAKWERGQPVVRSLQRDATVGDVCHWCRRGAGGGGQRITSIGLRSMTRSCCAQRRVVASVRNRPDNPSRGATERKSPHPLAPSTDRAGRLVARRSGWARSATEGTNPNLRSVVRC